MTKTKLISTLKYQSNVLEQICEFIDKCEWIDDPDSIGKFQDMFIYKEWKRLDELIEKIENGEKE